MKPVIRSILVACALFAAHTGSWAQTPIFPSKPIRIVVPLGPGSGLDASARKVSQYLAEVAHQPVIVENRPGADAAIGIREVLNAPADGHTLVAMTGGMLYMTPFLIKDLAYDPADIKPLMGLGMGDAVLVTGINGSTDLAQFMAAAKKKNGATFFGNYSQTFRGARLMLEKVSGVRFTEVAYKGAGQLTTDLIGGAFEAAFIDTASALPLIKAGRIRALATTGVKRNGALPKVPTIAESGYPTFSLMVWSGLGISKKTPQAISDKLEAMASAAANRPEMLQYFAEQQSQPMNMNSAQLIRFVDQETALYRDLLK